MKAAAAFFITIYLVGVLAASIAIASSFGTLWQVAFMPVAVFGGWFVGRWTLRTFS